MPTMTVISGQNSAGPKSQISVSQVPNVKHLKCLKKHLMSQVFRDKIGMDFKRKR